MGEEGRGESSFLVRGGEERRNAFPETFFKLRTPPQEVRKSMNRHLKVQKVLRCFSTILPSYFLVAFLAAANSSSISKRSGAERLTPMPCSISSIASCSPFIRAMGVLSG